MNWLKWVGWLKEWRAAPSIKSFTFVLRDWWVICFLPSSSINQLNSSTLLLHLPKKFKLIHLIQTTFFFSSRAATGKDDEMRRNDWISLLFKLFSRGSEVICWIEDFHAKEKSLSLCNFIWHSLIRDHFSFQLKTYP